MCTNTQTQTDRQTDRHAPFIHTRAHTPGCLQKLQACVLQMKTETGNSTDKTNRHKKRNSKGQGERNKTERQDKEKRNQDRKAMDGGDDGRRDGDGERQKRTQRDRKR